MPTPSPISGKRILVAEDDALLAMMIEDDLIAHGAIVIGPLSSCSRTLAVLHDGVSFDAAILDINLLDGQVYEAADTLLQRGTPFVFASSASRDSIPERFSSVALFYKPMNMRHFIEELFLP